MLLLFVVVVYVVVASMLLCFLFTRIHNMQLQERVFAWYDFTLTQKINLGESVVVEKGANCSIGQRMFI